MSGRATFTPRAPGAMWDDDSQRDHGQYTKNGQDLDPEIRLLNNRGLTMPTLTTALPKMPPQSQSSRPPSEERRPLPQEPPKYAESRGRWPRTESTSREPAPSQPPQHDRPRDNRSRGDRYLEDHSGEDRYRSDRLREDRSASDRHRSERPQEERPERDRSREVRSAGDRHRSDRHRSRHLEEEYHQRGRSQSEQPLRNPPPRGTVNRESSRPPPVARASTAPHTSSSSGRYAPLRPAERQPARFFVERDGRSGGAPPAPPEATRISARGTLRPQPRSVPRSEGTGGEGSSRAGREQRGRSPPARRSSRR